MSGKTKWDYLKAIYVRYRKASKPLRSRILDEFCQVCGYNRKYAIRLLSGPGTDRWEAQGGVDAFQSAQTLLLFVRLYCDVEFTAVGA